jgi:hypothetical protein
MNRRGRNETWRSLEDLRTKQGRKAMPVLSRDHKAKPEPGLYWSLEETDAEAKVKRDNYDNDEEGSEDEKCDFSQHFWFGSEVWK